MRTFRFKFLLCLTCTFAAAALHNWNDLRKGIRETLHIPERLPKLEDKRYGDFSPAPGITADRVSYGTAYNLRVPAIVYHSSDPKRKRGPALVIVNGHGGDKSSWYAYWAGILYARAGAVVLTYDTTGEFERNHLRESGTSQHDTYLPPDDMGRRMGGLMVEDIMQAASYLSRRKDVDKGRIAVLGYSMGSFISSLECAVDTRVRVCVLVGGGDLDGLGGYWDGSRKMCQAIPYRSLKFLGDRGPMIYALHAKRGPTLVWNGTADAVVDIPHHGQDFFANLREHTIAEAGSQKNVFDFGFTSGGGHRPYFITKPVALWLENKLNFPNWTEDSIKAMPETHISEWATRNHLNISSLKNEQGEGGTMALGNDVPAIHHDLLHALPDSVWNTQRDRYLYETWVDHAKAAIRSDAKEAQ
ncbi:MAG: alpha/beta fold hydrolase [Acidobacteriaceae bacterium]|nr:alpha/beta fold hydrolase [Acidobacteriaceae bacterium]